MTQIRFLAALALAFFVAACTGGIYRDTSMPIAPQMDFNAERYLGRWYEIARYPVPFQKGCTATTADYGPIDATHITVINTCRQDSPDGPRRSIEGTAEVVGPGALKVRFGSVPFVAADYWVLWVDEAYQIAVVGVPSGRAGWILARTPSISAADRARAEAELVANGYDPARLIEVPHATD
ncbi:lipocalin family protein [Tateyamaria pelophila]|uniref:lipocalin family protein n=1 Tax=Tateyamaria pelophila TaxID=328415 RepID=UPI001CBCC597|nr:lipocalin family protein [Tateyamaria pelophila]